MASSTSEPMAMASPPKLIVLIVRPSPWRVRMATSKDRGRATSEIIVVRTFIKKKKSTTTTKIAPSNNACCMLEIELSIKRDWRNMSEEIFTSDGNVFCRSTMAWSSLSVSSSVFVFGCFVMVTSTAGFALSEASPSFGSFGPICTVAMSDNKTGTLFTVFTTPLPISSTSFVAKRPCTMYSLPYSYRIPPVEFWFMLSTTVNTSSMLIP